MTEAHACEQLAQVCCSDGRKSNPRVHRPNHCTTISHGAQTALPVFTQRYLDRFIHFPGLAVVTDRRIQTHSQAEHATSVIIIRILRPAHSMRNELNWTSVWTAALKYMWFRTDRALAVLVTLQPISTKYSRDADARDQWPHCVC